MNWTDSLSLIKNCPLFVSDALNDSIRIDSNFLLSLLKIFFDSFIFDTKKLPAHHHFDKWIKHLY